MTFEFLIVEEANLTCLAPLVVMVTTKFDSDVAGKLLIKVKRSTASLVMIVARHLLGDELATCGISLLDVDIQVSWGEAAEGSGGDWCGWHAACLESACVRGCSG